MNEQRRLSGLAERIRARLKEFDDTLSDPTQAQDSDAMKLLASQDGHILLVNEDGYTWIDSADQWQEVASEDG